jgi:hypothetical protein
MCGECHNWDPGGVRVSSQLRNRLKPVHATKGQIQEHQSDVIGPSHCQGIFDSISLQHADVKVVEAQPDQARNAGVIVDDEHILHPVGSGRSPRVSCPSNPARAPRLSRA